MTTISTSAVSETVSVVSPVTPSWLARIVVVPWSSPVVASPAAEIVATLSFVLDHAAVAVRLRVVPFA